MQYERTAPVADLENFGGGDFKHETSKIRMSSPKLSVIFRPNSEIQTFFRPNSGGLQKKKKRSSPKLGVIFRPDSLGLGWWAGGGGCIPNWSRIIRNRGWFFGQNRYF